MAFRARLSVTNITDMMQALMMALGIIEFREVPYPDRLNEKEVLFKVKKIGICGSDVHVYHGEHPAVIYHVVQGHEYAAEVVAVGSEVQNIRRHEGNGAAATGMRCMWSVQEWPIQCLQKPESAGISGTRSGPGILCGH